MTGPDWLLVLAELADEADRIALRHFRQRGLRVEEKADRSPVSEADREIEQAVRRLVGARYPGLGVMGEEFGEAQGGAGVRLIVDPIDGTRNFVRGIPVFATLLGVEADGEVIAGLVSAPALGVRWQAARAAGAFRNGTRLAVSTVHALDRALLFHGNLARGEAGPPPGLSRLIPRVHRTRGFGDFWQHVLVAEGAGEIAVDPVVKPWDVAPLQVIVEEAGGRATTLGGERSIYGGSLVTTNGVLHRAVLDMVGSS